jgi:hypothetical protein
MIPRVKLLIILMMLVILPITTSLATFEKSKSFDQIRNNELFQNCYINISGSLENQWKINFLKPYGDYRSTVLFWHLELQSDNQLTISDKNGEILYQFNGAVKLNIFRFSGIYIPKLQSENGPLHMSINGHVGRILFQELAKSNSENENRHNLRYVNDKESFLNCYIEVQGHIHNDWPAVVKLPNMLIAGWIQASLDDVLFGSYSYILFEDDADIKIYEKKDGTLLWEHQGQLDPLLTIIGYRGYYSYINPEQELQKVTLSGKALFASIRLDDFGT